MKKITKATSPAGECSHLISVAMSNEMLVRRRTGAALQMDALRKTGKHSGQSAESLLRSHRKNHV